MFNIDFIDVFKKMRPGLISGTILHDIIASITKPIQDLNTRTVYAMQFNSQIASFEYYLNGEYSIPYDLSTRLTDIASGTIIWIENVARVKEVYIYRRSEGQLPEYIVQKWNPLIVYAANDFRGYKGVAYKSLHNANAGAFPDLNPLSWQPVGLVPYLFRRNDPYFMYDFIVKVPASLTFDINELRGHIEKYKLAGKRYNILTYP